MPCGHALGMGALADRQPFKYSTRCREVLYAGGDQRLPSIHTRRCELG